MSMSYLDLFSLAGKVALVTGANTGLGQGIAIALARAGADIVAVGRSDASATGREVENAGRRFFSVSANLENSGEVSNIVRSALESAGRIDILVNNAGIGVKPARPVEEMPADEWDRMVHVHMRSTFLWSRGVIPHMKAGGFGRIVNTSSSNFTGGGRPGVAHYSAAKAGIVGFTRTLAKEVGPFGITANAIAPGFVATELIGQFTDDMRERLRSQNPVGRMCRPEEVAALVAFLCSTHAAFINGECVCIDGGRRDFYWG